VAKKVCPVCGAEEMEEVHVRITYPERPKKPAKDAVVYWCNKKSCNGVFLPASIFGIGP